MCDNMEIIVSNFSALEALQIEFHQLNPTIERFQKKLMNMGEKM